MKNKDKYLYASVSLFASVLFSNISIAEGLAPVTKGMGYSFSLQQGMSGNFTTNQVPSLPIPTMTDIPAYVKSHNNSLPEMWGFDQTATSSTYTQLGNPAIGTQLTCKAVNGCRGQLKIGRYDKGIAGLPALIAFDMRDYNTQAENYFVIQDNSNSFNEFYFLNSSSKKYEPFNIDQDMQTENPVVYDVKYGDVIGYISFKSLANEYACLEEPTPPVGTLACTTPYPFTPLTSQDGTQEKLLNGTFWNLKWFDYLTQGTGFEKNVAVTHGLSTTDTISSAVQIGSETTIGDPAVAQEKLTLNYTHTWGTAITVTDTTTTTDNMMFPAQNYNQIVGAYTLSLGMKTIAPNLEKFLAQVNKEKMENGGSVIQWELTKANTLKDSEVDNSTDALLATNPNYIYGLLAVKE